MSNFVGAIICVVCLGLANFGVEAFREVPNYIEASKTTWNQLWAIGIYWALWLKD
jgi:hypothetical protein